MTLTITKLFSKRNLPHMAKLGGNRTMHQKMVSKDIARYLPVNTEGDSSEFGHSKKRVTVTFWGRKL